MRRLINTHITLARLVVVVAAVVVVAMVIIIIAALVIIIAIIIIAMMIVFIVELAQFSEVFLRSVDMVHQPTAGVLQRGCEIVDTKVKQLYR